MAKLWDCSWQGVFPKSRPGGVDLSLSRYPYFVFPVLSVPGAFKASHLLQNGSITHACPVEFQLAASGSISLMNEANLNVNFQHKKDCGPTGESA